MNDISYNNMNTPHWEYATLCQSYLFTYRYIDYHIDKY